MVEDHAADDQRHDQQHDDRDEVREVLADRERHFAPSLLEPNGRSFLRSSGSAFLAAASRPRRSAASCAGRAVEVRPRLLVTGGARLVRRAACPGRPAGCRAARRRCCRTAGRCWRWRSRARPTASRRRSGSARTCRCRRSSGPRRRARRACRRTPCSSRTPLVNSSWITTLPVGAGHVVAHSDARLVCGSSSIAASVTLARAALAGAQLRGQAAELLRAHQRPRLGDPRERGVDRGRRLADAREDLARERARGRERAR